MNRKMKLWIILISICYLFSGFQGMVSSAIADEATLQGFALSSDNASQTPWDPDPWNLNTYSLFTESFSGEHSLTLMGTETPLQKFNDMEYWTHLPVSPPSEANGETVTITYGTNIVSGRIPSEESTEGYSGIIEMPVSYNLHVSGGTRTDPIISWTNEFNSLYSGYAPIDQYRIRVFDMANAQVFSHQMRSDEIDLWGSDQSFDFSTVGFSFLADSQYRIRIEAREYVDMLETAGAGSLEYFLVINRSSAEMDYYTDLDARTVYGRVLDNAGNPVPGLWVHAFDKGCGGSWVGGGRTDNQGYYAIYGISSSDVYVQACANCDNLMYTSYWWTGTGNPGSFDCNDAQNLDIPAGAVASDINFTLEPSGSIEGYVKDKSGQIIQGLHVYVRSEKCGGIQFSQADTDDQGYYQISGIPAGDVYVYACPECNGQNYVGEWGYYNDQGDFEGTLDCNKAAAVTVNAGQSTPLPDFQLSPGAIVSGTVIDQSTGSAVTGKWVDVTIIAGDPCGERYRVGDTSFNSQDGTYEIVGIPPGSYYLVAWSGDSDYVGEWWADSWSSISCQDAQQIIINSGDTIINHDFQLEEGGYISGTVTDSDGNGIPGLWVEGFSGKCWDSHINGMITDDGDHAGEYKVGPLPEGTVYLHACPSCNNLFYVDQWYSGQQDCNDAVGVQVSKNVVTEHIDFSLQNTLTISGQVLDHENNPIEGLWVGASDRPCGGNGLGGGYTDTNGIYTIHGIPPGDVYVQTCARCDNKMYTDYWWTGPDKTGSIDCNDAASLLEIAAGNDAVGIDFTLDPAGGVSGVVKDVAGNGIEGVHVYAETLTSDGRRLWVSGTNTNSSGVYTLTGIPTPDPTVSGIPEGTAYIRAFPGARGQEKDYVNKWYDLSGGTFDYEGAYPVTVLAGFLTAGIDFTLEDAGRIAGYVYQDGTTQGISNMHIQVKSAACGYSFQYSEGNTDENGYFYIAGIPAGDVNVFACPGCSGLNYVGEWYNGGDGTRDCGSADTVNVKINKTTAVEPPFSLSPGMTVSGKVVAYQDPADQSDPVPVSGLWVHAFDNACGGNWLGGAYTRSDGTYDIYGLPQDVAVYVGACPQCDNLPYIGAWYDGGDGIRHCGDAVAVTAGASVDFILKTGHQISFTINGEDVAGIDISVHDYNTDEYLHSGRVDANSFTLSGIPAGPSGKYKVYLNTGTSYYINEIYNDNVPIAVFPGDNVAFTPEKGGRITGFVYGSDGQGVPNICINAEHLNCGGYISGMGTYPDGFYEFAVPAPEPSGPGDPLPPVFYTLHAHPPCNPDEDYFDEYWTAEGGVSNCYLAEPVEVKWGEETIKNFDLEPGGMISGDFDADGDVDGKDLAEYRRRIEDFSRTVITLEDLAWHLGM